MNVAAVGSRKVGVEEASGVARRLRRSVVRERRWTTATIWAGALIVGVILLVSLLAPLLGLPNPNQVTLLGALEPPSMSHPFGTDSLGRDIFTRVLYAGRLDIGVGLFTTYVPLCFGVAVGTAAGYFGGRWETVVMRLVDVVLAFPFVVLVLAIAAIFGQGVLGIVVGITVIGWAPYTRIARAEMLSLRERQFMLAAQTLGYSRRRIVLRHGVPNLIRSSLVFSMADIVRNIATIASISFLGAGVRVPTAEWGAMIAEGQNYLLSAWWIATFPGLVLVLVGVGFSLMGDGIADRLGTDVRLTG